ncbi:hypothetical protein [Shewanella marisflavi]|uniref:hypothetical protein n=1 Tax=Shewanella marisflavi TaxID=260364 RepID=UPI003AAC3EE1
MSTYTTQAYFLLPLSESQVNFALSVLNCIQDRKLDFEDRRSAKTTSRYGADCYNIAKQLYTKHEDAFDYEERKLTFDVDVESDGLWISHDETLHSEAVAQFCRLILKHFDLDTYVLIQAARTADVVRPGAFGGHAAFVTKKGIKWMCTEKWLEQQARAFDREQSRVTATQ